MHINTNERGFTYIDLLIGMSILLVSVMALAAAITASVVKSREGQHQLSAKQLAASTLENIFSARDINTLGWNAIGNVGTNPVNGVNQGIFLTGRQPIRPNPGIDGVVGTADDTGVAPADTARYLREIVITDYNDPERPVAAGFPIMIRQITVRVSYMVGNIRRQETATTMITNYQVQ